MANQKYALLVDYTYFTGSFSAEVAAKMELGLKDGEYAIKEIQVGPFEVTDSNGDAKWEWNYIPVPTEIFSQHWGTNGDKAGQLPLACKSDESASMYYGTVDEMVAKMAEFDRRMVLFQL